MSPFKDSLGLLWSQRGCPSGLQLSQPQGNKFCQQPELQVSLQIGQSLDDSPARAWAEDSAELSPDSYPVEIMGSSMGSKLPICNLLHSLETNKVPMFVEGI